MTQHDCLQRFLFKDLGVRGEWVHLHQSWQDSIQHQNLSIPVQQQLGKALAASVLLSARLKFNGSLILQLQGDGALKTLVAQSTHDRKIRGLARGNTQSNASSLADMMGHGRLVITLESKDSQPYQGVVGLQNHHMASLITDYFIHSEQLKTQIWLCSNQTHIAGLLIQELPSQSHSQADWEHIITLAKTVTDDELLSIDCQTMLYRLFHQEKLLLFDPEPVSFGCTCSREKIKTTLISLGYDELKSILSSRDRIVVDCEFCRQQYSFDSIDVEMLFSQQLTTDDENIQH